MAVAVLVAIAAKCIVTNEKAPLDDVTVPFSNIKEDTSMVTQDLIKEARMGCGKGTVNVPVLCKVQTYDSCGNAEGEMANETSIQADVKALGEQGWIQVSNVVHSTGNEFRFHFTADKVGVYQVSLNITFPLSVVVQKTLVVMSDTVQSCTTLPQHSQAREAIEAGTRYSDLTSTVTTFKHPTPASVVLRENAIRSAATHNGILQTLDVPRGLPPPTQFPALGHTHPNNILKHTTPPTTTFLGLPDGFCQTFDKSY
eukprot:TRINITY_DN7230_c0_g1_i1.p1 TRINITY_DN7230_c0_g1~~TRINITY_DN7230_c0_g1_i1.p1  ORF type:complete len:256 (+),score=39.96 TRINITY_DN7230_c0_g1_i1:277-1044(+)